MPRTPDRFPGIREDEGYDVDPGTEQAAAEGQIRYVGGHFSLYDTDGEYDPRNADFGNVILDDEGRIVYVGDGVFVLRG